MPDLTALGELLIDFTYYGQSAGGTRLFEQNCGGAPANVACCAARLGANAAFIGKVGDDMHGTYLKHTLEAYGVDTHNLLVDNSVFTTLAFVSLEPNGERSFSFARKPGADTFLQEDELDPALLQSTKVLSVGSLSLTDEPARSATLAAVRIAKEAGACIAYDPNYRPSLWPSPAFAAEQMRSLLPYVDLLKVSEEELAILVEAASPEQAIRTLHAMGIGVVAVTLGDQGALLGAHHAIQHVPAFATHAVDTTGAGDAFWGAFLFAYLQSEKPLSALTFEDILHFAVFGNAAASCCVQKRGAIPAMPSLEEAMRTYRFQE